jgi:transposase
MWSPHSELCVGQNHSKIATGFRISRSLVYKMKKLLEEGVDLKLWQRGGKK